MVTMGRNMQAASGLSRKAFCEGSGIALSTFAYWKRKLRTKRDGGPARYPEDATGVRQEEKTARIIRYGAIAVWNGRLHREIGSFDLTLL